MRLTFILGAILGAILCFLVIDSLDKRLPPGIEVVKDGKVVGYANTARETTEFVYIENAKSPGMFMAFPIFGDQSEFPELNK